MRSHHAIWKSILWEGLWSCGKNSFLAGVKKWNLLLEKGLLHRLQNCAKKLQLQKQIFQKIPVEIWHHFRFECRFSCATVKSLAGFCFKNNKKGLLWSVSKAYMLCMCLLCVCARMCLFVRELAWMRVTRAKTFCTVSFEIFSYFSSSSSPLSPFPSLSFFPCEVSCVPFIGRVSRVLLVLELKKFSFSSSLIRF